jgi:hypothetical protein
VGLLNSLKYWAGGRRRGEKLGLQIKYSESAAQGNLIIFEADISVGYGKPSKKFITSPEIRELLQRKDAKGLYSKRYFGKIWWYYDKKRSKVSFMRYYPVPQMSGKIKFPEIFRGRGIAERIESRFEEEFRRRFGSPEKISHAVTFPRMEQLNKRGITEREMKEGYPYEKYRATLRAKVARDLKKARAKRNLKPRLPRMKK